MSSWEEQMAEKHRDVALQNKHAYPFYQTKEEIAEQLLSNSLMAPKEEAEQSLIDYCGDEGPPYCGKIKWEHGWWGVLIVCETTKEGCIHGHTHHEDELWLAS